MTGNNSRTVKTIFVYHAKWLQDRMTRYFLRTEGLTSSSDLLLVVRTSSLDEFIGSTFYRHIGLEANDVLGQRSQGNWFSPVLWQYNEDTLAGY